MAIDLVSAVTHFANIILLIPLLYIYISNYKKLKSKYTAGLLFFAGFLLLETLMALYFDTTMVMYYSAAAASNAQIVQIVKAVGLAVLLWISLE
ncbi:MAG: hypothetical protein HY518_01990 [Candidatus Aenigmarchaeota archaeon]|nr:hypothetical protein [Candidatus Aenigmarchaeota archaeon]